MPAFVGPLGTTATKRRFPRPMWRSASFFDGLADRHPESLNRFFSFENSSNFMRYSHIISNPKFVSGISAVTLWLISIFIGMQSNLVLPVVPRDPDYQPWGQVMPIFVNNASAAFSLYSGILFLGSTTIIQSIVLGLFSGGAIHAAASGFGISQTADLLVPYFVFEALGLMVATWAGLLPVTTLIIQFHQKQRERGFKAFFQYTLGRYLILSHYLFLQ